MIVLIIIAIIAVLAAPLLGIWALNTLFPVVAIPYTLATWFAMLIVMGMVKTNVNVKRKRD